VTDHSEVRRIEDRAERLQQRWRRIALEALKQCRRRKMVEIAEPLGFPDFCRSQSGTTGLIFSERGGRSLREAALSLSHTVASGSINLCIGPEGGWSDHELQVAEEYGLIPVDLGPRILRAETAALASVTLAQHLFGDVK
jgi:16S rRNA (uracil1498-N3)-methyltransferase